MPEHAVFSEDMREVVESFVVETQDILEELNADLIQLEDTGDPALVDKVFRAVHTVKGTSSFLGLEQLNTLAHHFEDVLNRLRDGDIDFGPGLIDVLFEAFDQMTALLQQVLEREITPLPLDNLLSRLQTLADRTKTGDAAVGGDGAVDPPPRAAAVDETTAEAVSPPSRMRGMPSTRRSGSVRVSIDRLEDLMALVGELTESREALECIITDLERAYGPIHEVSELHERADRIDTLAGRLHAVVLNTRMVAIETVFKRFPRVARDLGRSLNKEVVMAFEGAETQLDRVYADRIGESLLHLIRNAIDHGLETRSTRIRTGKPAAGTITLRAREVDGDVEVSVRDDGRGLDPDAILNKAVARGQLSSTKAKTLSTRDIYDLIWEAGFSTTDEANQVSGRGVGMDVVRTTVSHIGGAIEVRSEPGRGTCFTLRLPQTASVKRCLLVAIGDHTYALPQDNVVDVFPVSPDRLSGNVLHLEDRDLPVVLLSGALHDLNGIEEPLAVVIQRDNGRAALLIDRLLGQEDVLHETPLPPIDPDGLVRASTVLSDGRGVFVLSISKIVRIATLRHSSSAGQNPT